MLEIAEMYEKGEGVKRSDSEAIKWYRRAAKKGLSEAQYILGSRYAKGIGVTANLKQAAKWYRLAAEMGHSGAHHELQKLEQS